MDHKVTALERAFESARSGKVSTIAEIKRSLERDGYSANQVDGPFLRRQLMGLIRARRQTILTPTGFRGGRHFPVNQGFGVEKGFHRRPSGSTSNYVRQ